MRIDPSKPPSRRPTACSSVDLPEPDGPSRATISPGWTSRSTPRSTSMVTSAWVKLRLSWWVRRTASLIAQHLDRVGARRFPRRVKRRQERQDEREQDDRRDLERVGLGRQLGQEANRRVPQMLAGQRLDRVHHALAEEQEDRADDQAEGDAERADRHSDG